MRAVLWICFISVHLTGCVHPVRPARTFDFNKDTFAFRNELVWEYTHTADGKTSTRKNNPPPTYYQRCFVISRAAREFFDHARFDNSLPQADDEVYRKLVRQVVARSARKPSREDERIVIPGYDGLRSFSQDWEFLLKAECGAAWQSYFQCGNWRVVFPFSDVHQEHTAARLSRKLEANRPVIVHLVRFPELSINHALLLYRAEKKGADIVFEGYDPNNTQEAVKLTFHGNTREFEFPRNNYFAGGAVHVYEVYTDFCH